MKSIALEMIRSKDYDKWEERAYENGGEPCVICGKRMTPSDLNEGHWLRMYEGGSFLTDDMETPDGKLPNDMGCFPVGKTCWNKFQKLAK